MQSPKVIPLTPAQFAAMKRCEPLTPRPESVSKGGRR